MSQDPRDDMEQGWHRVLESLSPLWARPLLTAKCQGRWEKLLGGGLLQDTNTDFIFATWYLAKPLAQIWTYINFCEIEQGHSR